MWSRKNLRCVLPRQLFGGSFVERAGWPVFPRGGDANITLVGGFALSLDLSPNERRVLRRLHQNAGPQAGLDEAIGMAQQSISRIVASLDAKGLVEVGPPRASGRRGKPSPQLSLCPSAVYSLGISVMADAVATGLIDFSGALLGHEITPVPGMTHADVLDQAERHVAELAARNGISRSNLCGIGVAMTGYFMGESRTFNPPAALRHWMDVDVAELFAQRLGLPAWAENDGNAAAIGEAALGAGRRYRNFVYFYFSAGFGGGVIVDGKLLTGRFGNAGEFAGVLPYNIYTHPNLEVLRQCLVHRGIDAPTVHALVSDFRPDWPGIDDWIFKVRDSLSLVASACSAILDTEAIVLGGLMPRSLAERLISDIEFYSMPRWGTRRPVPKILPAEAPGDAALFGAASIPLERLFF